MFRMVAILVLGLVGVNAASSVKELAGVPLAELPAKAAALVKEAEGVQQAMLAVAAIQFANETDPKAVVPVVAAIAKAVPRAAADAANTATSLQASNAVAIARAAAGGAPGYAPLIVYAVLPHVPEQFSEVTIEIAIAAPEQAHSIIYALNQAIPSVRDYVERAKSSVQSGRTTRPSVALLMYETEEMIEAEGEGIASEVIKRLHQEDVAEALAEQAEEETDSQEEN